jgi:pimeloyl-ACP methyl ester carboxylesterase
VAQATLGEVSIHYQHLKRRGARSSHTTPPCVIYIHGLIMDNLSSGYFTFAHAMSELTDVLLYDLRGHGKSAQPSTRYRIEDHIHDLSALIEHLQIEGKIHLIGCSFGGLIALEFALRYPAQVHSLVLIDGHINPTPFLDQLTLDLRATGETRAQLIGQHFQHWLHRDRTRKRMRLIQRAETLIYQTSLLEDLKTSESAIGDVLKNIQLPCPMLALYGSRSDAYASALDMLTHPSVTLHLFEESAHAILWEHTEEVITLMKTWVEG